jgi:hypothetical protein
MNHPLVPTLISALLFSACSTPTSRMDVHDGAPHHTRPIVEVDGRTLLWAGEEDWFDVTKATINPATFQYGIGKDTIPSIDAPIFVLSNDPRLEATGVTMDTPVLGVLQEGVAKAYPVFLMDHHEIVNDRFGDLAFAVLW